MMNQTSHKKSANPALLLNIHLAEYNALTGRCTAWLSFILPIWTVLVAFLGLTLAGWNYIPPVIRLWGTLFGIQLLFLLWFQTIEEQYLAVKYIKKFLIPKIRSIINANDFWAYEPFSSGRSGLLSWWGEWCCPSLTVAFALIGIGLAGNHENGVKQSDWVGLFFNAILLLIQVCKTEKRIQLREEISDSRIPPFFPTIINFAIKRQAAFYA